MASVKCANQDYEVVVCQLLLRRKTPRQNIYAQVITFEMYSNICTHIRVSVLACCPCICLLAVAERKKEDIFKSRQSGVETPIVYEEVIKEGMISFAKHGQRLARRRTRRDKGTDGDLFSATTSPPLRSPPPPPSATADRR